MWSAEYRYSVDNFNQFKPSRDLANAVKCMWRQGDVDVLEVVVEREIGESAGDWSARHKEECRGELDKYLLKLEREYKYGE